MSQNGGLPKAEASPTKTSFIDILVRDVKLEEAISELVDNAVDGAKRLRPDKNFEGLYIHIVYNETSFSIEDNCGGMSAQLAKDYAFRFGRPSDFPKKLQPKLGIGQFGIGMKRALFMMGRDFRVESTTSESRFKLHVPVNDWLKEKDKQGDESWKFNFEEFEEKLENLVGIFGTTIIVTKLKAGVLKKFTSGKFTIGLTRNIESEQAESLLNGLEIVINGKPLVGKRRTR